MPSVDLKPCNAPGVYFYGEHLARWPESQTRPVSWCPKCLGTGQVEIVSDDILDFLEEK